VSLTFIRPTIPTDAARPPPGDAWLHEPKWDGYRFQVVKGRMATATCRLLRISSADQGRLPDAMPYRPDVVGDDLRFADPSSRDLGLQDPVVLSALGSTPSSTWRSTAGREVAT